MLKESGGINSDDAEIIKKNAFTAQNLTVNFMRLPVPTCLYIKMEKQTLNSQILELMKLSEWIESKGITKVLMNPPFERKYGCIPIVKTFLDSVSAEFLYEFKLIRKQRNSVKLKSSGIREKLNVHLSYLIKNQRKIQVLKIC